MDIVNKWESTCLANRFLQPPGSQGLEAESEARGQVFTCMGQSKGVLEDRGGGGSWGLCQGRILPGGT